MLYSAFTLPEKDAAESKLKCNTEKDAHARLNYRTAGWRMLCRLFHSTYSIAGTLVAIKFGSLVPNSHFRIWCHCHIYYSIGWSISQTTKFCYPPIFFIIHVLTCKLNLTHACFIKMVIAYTFTPIVNYYC